MLQATPREVLPNRGEQDVGGRSILAFVWLHNCSYRMKIGANDLYAGVIASYAGTTRSLLALIDSFSFTVVPEPGVGALLALGLGGLLLARRCRRFGVV